MGPKNPIPGAGTAHKTSGGPRTLTIVILSVSEESPHVERRTAKGDSSAAASE